MSDDGNDTNMGAEIAIPAGPHAVATGLGAARDFCRDADCPADFAWRLAIVVEELLFNLIDHADLPDDAPIVLNLCRTSDGVHVVLTDTGHPFDPRGLMPAADVPDRGGGAGIALVMAWARDVDYRTERGRNRLALTVPIVDLRF